MSFFHNLKYTIIILCRRPDTYPRDTLNNINKTE